MQRIDCSGNTGHGIGNTSGFNHGVLSVLASMRSFAYIRFERYERCWQGVKELMLRPLDKNRMLLVTLCVVMIVSWPVPLDDKSCNHFCLRVLLRLSYSSNGSAKMLSLKCPATLSM